MALVWALVGFGLLRVLLLLGFIVVLVCIRLDWCFGLVWFGTLLGLVCGASRGVDQTQGLSTHARQVLSIPLSCTFLGHECKWLLQERTHMLL